MTPEAIGRYRIIGTLGSGGFATVFLAEDPRLDAQVAIKLLSADMAADENIRARFIEEARVMRRLAAPGLVTVHDIDEFEHRPYFVMEHCARGTLDDRLQQLGRPLQPSEGLGLADALARSTAGIHGAGVVHRDLKPGNYLIRQTPTSTRTMLGALLHPDEELVVADFGLAKTVDPTATRLTIAGGTPGYSAPEQFRADPSVDARADVYALSAIVVAALSGEQPQPVLAPGAHAFTREALERTGPMAPGLARGLSLDREHRQRDVVEWRHTLSTVAGAAAVPQPTSDPATGATAHAPPTPQALAGFAPPTVPTAHAEPAAPPVTPGANPGSDPNDRTWTEQSPHTTPAPTPVFEAPVPQPTGATGAPTAGGRRWLGPVLAVGALLAVGLLGIGALVGGLVSLPGPTVIGPVEGAVGEEAVFALDSADAHTWSVDGREAASGRIIALAPTEPGTYEITATSGLRATTISYTVEAASGPLRIVGPGLAPVGEPTVLTAEGIADGAAAVWTIGGSEFTGTTVEVRPTNAGTIEVVLRAATGETTNRTITASTVSEETSG